MKDDRGKPMIKDSRLETIKKRSGPYKEIYHKNNRSESFANWFYENHLLGYTYGKRLIDIFAEKTNGLMPIINVENAEIDETVAFVGTIEDKPYFGKSRNDNEYMKVFIKDETASMKVMIFSGKLSKMIVENSNKHPEQGNIVIVRGIKKDEVIFADQIAIQTNKIYTKLSDLKEA